ncbi:unnamed protein product [Umbelopsis vinacea]
MAEIGNWIPVSLLSNGVEDDMLNSTNIANILVDHQISGIWSLPTQPETNRNCVCGQNEAGTSDFCITDLTQNDNLKFLRNEKFVELNDEICNLLNRDWLLYPQLRYLHRKSSQRLSLSTSRRPLWFTAQNHMGDHGYRTLIKRRLPGSESSCTTSQGRYGWVNPTSFFVDGGQKLVIGTQTCNILISASMKLEAGSGHMVEMEQLHACLKEDGSAYGILQEILLLMDDNESILIIGNQALSRKLTDLASIVTSGLQRANAGSRDQLRQLLLNGQ